MLPLPLAPPLYDQANLYELAFDAEAVQVIFGFGQLKFGEVPVLPPVLAVTELITGVNGNDKISFDAIVEELPPAFEAYPKPLK